MSLVWESGQCGQIMVKMGVGLLINFWGTLSPFPLLLDVVVIETIPGKCTSSWMKWALTWILVSFLPLKTWEGFGWCSETDMVVGTSRRYSNKIQLLSGPEEAQAFYFCPKPLWTFPCAHGCLHSLTLSILTLFIETYSAGFIQRVNLWPYPSPKNHFVSFLCTYEL